MYKTKQERQSWWNSLTKGQQADYMRKRERTRDVSNRVTLNLPALTKGERLAINTTMRNIGMEAYIVLSEE